jgi:hypothetical protein
MCKWVVETEMVGLQLLQQSSLLQPNSIRISDLSLDAAITGRAPLHVPTPLWNLSSMSERAELLQAGETPSVGAIQPVQTSTRQSIDALVLDAHNAGRFPGAPNFRYNHPSGLEQIFYI